MDKKKLKALLMAKGFGVEGAEIAINAVWEYIQKSQAEAIKEFVDKLKEIANSIVAVNNGQEIYETKCYNIMAYKLDDLVQEMGCENADNI